MLLGTGCRDSQICRDQNQGISSSSDEEQVRTIEELTIVFLRSFLLLHVRLSILTFAFVVFHFSFFIAVTLNAGSIFV